MPSYDFALILSRPLYEDELDPLFDRTYGAVTVSIMSEPQHADRHHSNDELRSAARPPAPARHHSNDELRSADRLGNASCTWPGATLAAAIMEVVGHVEESAPGVHVLRVEADPLLTIRDIAERVGRSLDSVRHAITGARGATGFPSSEMSTAGHRLWRWSKVAAWYGLDDPQLIEAKPTVQAINGWLALRDVVPDIAPAPEEVTSALSLVIPHVA
ncbi:hypothetical protein ACFQY7_34190 [Actinomadura luteofluorescens]|uniref:Uncharacterized protein n=1 Tax=Actinomadura luteofluorescens TaxID=46163 RepID=A0A7Y9EK28_9ACTN|nr:hypothetical protein [Actinomadura luteofluorescens]NYD49183.1 hypothetical protein [Actinomadura luteofluorescens]